MQSPPFPRYLAPPRSKYSPQHHALKHPQLSFLLQCQQPSFTPMQNRQNYTTLHFTIYSANSTHTWETKIEYPKFSSSQTRCEASLQLLSWKIIHKVPLEWSLRKQAVYKCLLTQVAQIHTSFLPPPKLQATSCFIRAPSSSTLSLAPGASPSCYWFPKLAASTEHHSIPKQSTLE